MSDANIREVVFACLIDWMQQPEPKFTADEIGYLLSRHAPSNFSLHARAHSFIILASVTRFLADTVDAKPLNSYAVNSMDHLGRRPGVFGYPIGQAVDVKA